MNKWPLCALAALLPALGFASTLTGDTITLSLNPGVYGPIPVFVDAGTDLVVGNFRFDFNAGVAGNQFVFNSTPDAGSLANSTSLTLDSLDFTDGSRLTGFAVAASQLTGLTISTTDHSATFAFSNSGFVGPGTVLFGTFITAAAVPAPETLPLVLGGLGILAVSTRRRALARSNR